eukprot:2251377-Rhodomonas_salina.1
MGWRASFSRGPQDDLHRFKEVRTIRAVWERLKVGPGCALGRKEAMHERGHCDVGQREQKAAAKTSRFDSFT